MVFSHMIRSANSPQALTVESMEKTVSSPVSNTATSVSLPALPILVALASEGSLVDLALGRPAEGHAVVLQLDDGGGSLPGHVVDGVLCEKIPRSHDIRTEYKDIFNNYLVSQPI